VKELVDFLRSEKGQVDMDVIWTASRNYNKEVQDSYNQVNRELAIQQWLSTNNKVRKEVKR